MSKKETAHGALDRLHVACGTGKNDSELARILDVKRSTLGSWRARGVPYSECVTLAEARGLSLDWLLLGRGEMTTDAYAPGIAAQTPREEAVLTLFRALTEDEQREIQAAAEEKKRLRDLEQRVEEMEAAASGRLAS